MPAYLMSASP